MLGDTYSALIPTPMGSLQISAASLAPQSGDRSVFLSLVVPTYNESRNINAIVDILSKLLDEALPDDYELIIVDDNSPDMTWKLALELVNHYPHLRVMCRQQERGLATAVIRGWQAARGQILGVIDGDLQHPPDILPKLLQSINNGADLAVASRHVEPGGVSEWNLIRRFLSRGAQTLGLIILPGVISRVSDPMSGYFMVRRSAIAETSLNPLGYKILIEVLGRGQINEIAEVGYVFQERKEGASKVTWKQYVEYLRHLLRLRFSEACQTVSNPLFTFPLRRFGRFGIVGLSGVFVDMLVLYLLSDPSALGWGLTRSKMIAAEVAIINNFIWNDSWTFGDLSEGQKGAAKRFKRFLKFNTICLAGLILNVLVLNLLFNVFGINRYVANLIAIAAVTLWNFWLNLKLSWRVTQI